jgi:membrane-associated protease RseP (regulator of RpoE activity)
VSSNLPQFPSVSSPYDTVANCPDPFIPKSNPSYREWFISAALFCITLLSTTYAGLFYTIGDVDLLNALRAFYHDPKLVIYGLPFSIPLILILLAHELGHFFACRYYGMRCTPPFFIPAPFPVTGTFGAFIKIKSHFPNKRVLFDIGIAGPLAGFALVVPALWIGISLSNLIPKGSFHGGDLSFGEPLIFRLLSALLLGYSPDKHEIIAHPIAMAAWVGLLATSLNLLPIWQLDGGHIAYAILGRARQKKLTVFSIASLIILSFWGWPTPSYLLLGILLLLIGARLRFYHPPTLLDEESLGAGRIFLGAIALLILIACFIPVPVSLT